MNHSSTFALQKWSYHVLGAPYVQASSNLRHNFLLGSSHKSPLTGEARQPSSINSNQIRRPGDLKVSWKWKSSLRFSRVEADQNKYKQVLSQVNFYMKQHGARYGYILTNTEFVAVKRLNSNGRLAVANPIPWTSGSIGQPSVLLGLWYLGMLVAENNNWALTA
ncbi:hypothetical protein V6Z79_008531 [Aspergillus fumigatus]